MSQKSPGRDRDRAAKQRRKNVAAEKKAKHEARAKSREATKK